MPFLNYLVTETLTIRWLSYHTSVLAQLELMSHVQLSQEISISFNQNQFSILDLPEYTRSVHMH